MRRMPSALVVLSVAIGAAGCFNPFAPRLLTQRVTSVAPSPSSPENAVKLFEWCWVNRGVEEYKELFTADYVFKSAELDSAGNQSRIETHRDEEIDTAQNMFVGSAERAPAARITLSFDRNLSKHNDTRAGKNPGWHQTIRTHVDLKVDIEEGNTLEVTGAALFYLTKGDSALIPTDLIARGFKPDPARWWIDRWEDETIGSGIAAALARHTGPHSTHEVFRRSMLEVKRYYLGR